MAEKRPSDALREAIYGKQRPGGKRPVRLRFSRPYADRLWADFGIFNKAAHGVIWGIPWQIDPTLPEGMEADYPPVLEVRSQS